MKQLLLMLTLLSLMILPAQARGSFGSSYSSFSGARSYARSSSGGLGFSTRPSISYATRPTAPVTPRFGYATTPSLTRPAPAVTRVPVTRPLGVARPVAITRPLVVHQTTIVHSPLYSSHGGFWTGYWLGRMNQPTVVYGNQGGYAPGYVPGYAPGAPQPVYPDYSWVWDLLFGLLLVGGVVWVVRWKRQG